MTTPAISVVIPTKDRRRLCRETVESCLATRGVPLEVIVVDDGSNDGTDEELAGLPITYVRQDWAGRSAARNRGAATASAPLIAFLDSDDLCVPDRFVRQLERLAPHHVACWGQVELVAADGSPLPDETAPLQGEVAAVAAGGATPERLAVTMRIYPSTVVVRRDAFERTGGFDERLFVAEDVEWLLRLARLGELAFEPGVVARIRRHDSNTAAEPMFVEAAEFTEWLARDADRRADRRYRARLRAYGARANWSLGRNAAARAAGWRAILDDPRVVGEPGFLKRHALSHLPAVAVNRLRRARPGTQFPPGA